MIFENSIINFFYRSHFQFTEIEYRFLYFAVQLY